jgi:hypothetical protein
VRLHRLVDAPTRRHSHTLHAGCGLLAPSFPARNPFILLLSVLVYDHSTLPRPVTILSILFHTRNPILVAGDSVTMVGTDAATDDPLKGAIPVIDRTTRL